MLVQYGGHMFVRAIQAMFMFSREQISGNKRPMCWADNVGDGLVRHIVWTCGVGTALPN